MGSGAQGGDGGGVVGASEDRGPGHQGVGARVAHQARGPGVDASVHLQPRGQPAPGNLVGENLHPFRGVFAERVAAEADITFENNAFSVAGTDKKLTLKQVAIASFQPARLPKGMEPGFIEHATYAPERATYPNGCHVCEVEVDPDTGKVDLLTYLVIDDVGTVINPMTLAGQVHGGVAQGVGQVLMEKVAYDPDSGQLLSASFMDYAMPRADNMCDISIVSNPSPTPSNPLGAKGGGEAGTVGALPSVMIAIMDALAPLGVRELEMPASPERVWQAIRAVAHA